MVQKNTEKLRFFLKKCASSLPRKVNECHILIKFVFLECMLRSNFIPKSINILIQCHPDLFGKSGNFCSLEIKK